MAAKMINTPLGDVVLCKEAALLYLHMGYHVPGTPESPNSAVWSGGLYAKYKSLAKKKSSPKPLLVPRNLNPLVCKPTELGNDTLHPSWKRTDIFCRHDFRVALQTSWTSNNRTQYLTRKRKKMRTNRAGDDK